MNRRTFLQATSAAASTIAASGPLGVAGATGVQEAAIAGGHGPYLVIWDKGVLERCGNYHDAVRRASVLRHMFGIQTNHLRCSPGLFSQLQGDPNCLWFEVDGVAVTPTEARKQGFDLLRRARDPERTRRQLWEHHLVGLRETIDLEDLCEPGTEYYAVHRGKIVAVAPEHAELLEGHEVHEWEIAACSPKLAEEIRTLLADREAQKPAINTSFTRHMTDPEYRTRLGSSPRFRAAALQPTEQRVPAEAIGKQQQCAVEAVDGWLFPVALSEHEDLKQDTPETMSMSAHLAKVLEVNKFVMPGFWRKVQGTAHHLDAFADNVSPPSIGGKRTRHQNRHT